MNFDNLNEYLVYRNEKPNHNVEYIYKFDNGFGASVLTHNYGYTIEPLNFNLNDSDFDDSIKSYTAPYVVLEFLETIKDK